MVPNWVWCYLDSSTGPSGREGDGVFVTRLNAARQAKVSSRVEAPDDDDDDKAPGLGDDDDDKLVDRPVSMLRT